MDVSEPTVAQQTLQHRLADLPESAVPHIRMGYTLLSSLDNHRLNEVIAYVTSNFSKRSRYDPDVAANISGIDRNIVGDLLSAIALTVGSVFDIDVSKEDFFKYAPVGLIEGEASLVVEKILNAAVAQKDVLKREFDNAKTANAVLPSFRYLDYAVDVRLSFNSEGEILNKIPVAIFYLDTDSKQEIWFQASPADLDDLIDKMTKAKTSMASICSAVGGWK